MYSSHQWRVSASWQNFVLWIGSAGIWCRDKLAEWMPTRTLGRIPLITSVLRKHAFRTRLSVIIKTLHISFFKTWLSHIWGSTWKNEKKKILRTVSTRHPGHSRQTATIRPASHRNTENMHVYCLCAKDQHELASSFSDFPIRKLSDCNHHFRIIENFWRKKFL